MRVFVRDKMPPKITIFRHMDDHGEGGLRKSGKGLFVFFACQTRLNERNFAQKRDKDSVFNKISLRVRLRLLVAGFSVPYFSHLGAFGCEKITCT
jgi:hypothetical protein